MWLLVLVVSPFTAPFHTWDLSVVSPDASWQPGGDEKVPEHAAVVAYAAGPLPLTAGAASLVAAFAAVPVPRPKLVPVLRL